MDYKEYQKLVKQQAKFGDGRRLVVLGAGESGVGAALLARQQGWEVFVSDGGSIREDYKSMLEKNGILFEEGGHSTERILAAGCIVKSPGIPEKAAIMTQIRENEIVVVSEIEFGFWYKGKSKIVAITGSNGKSTTTSLTYHIFKDDGRDVSMVGNIGRSFALQIFQQPTEWYVMEISSFQLDDTYLFKPDISVLLNITPDHLDRYNYQFENYVESKFRIARQQDEKDVFITNADDPIITSYLADHSLSVPKIYFTMNELTQSTSGAFVIDEEIHFRYDGEDDRVSINDLAIKGKHNQYNSMAAGISARSGDIRKSRIRESLASFKGLDHRLEEVASVRGVRFINDSKGTNMNSVWYALESMKQPTILILGGLDKGNDYGEIMDLVRQKVKAIVCLGLDNSRIHEAFDPEVKSIVDVQSAVDAVKASYKLAEPGDVVLLSPGCASFDLFKNYEDRGQQFKDAVIAL
jgi:UDP-N-acetylmuramoylalanine--D-glutamate ligase